MNDATSTPDEPDGRGRVATDEQAAIPKQATGTDESAAVGAEGGNGGPAAQADGSPPEQSAAEAPAQQQEGAASAQPDGAEAGQQQPSPAGPPAQAAAAQGDGSAPAQPADVPTADPPLDPTGGDAPTAQLPIAQPGAASNSSSAQAAPSPAPRAASAATDESTADTAAPRSLDPEPSPGPIPGPGPDAAAPPPWNRMPQPRDAGQDQPTQVLDDQQMVIDEGPTAFLEPPTFEESDARDSGSSPSKSGAAGWSSVRSVRSRPPRQAVLQVKRFDPWAALKLGLVLAVVLFFIWLVAVGVLYGALDGMGVWDRLNGTYADLVSGDAPSEGPLISAGRVFGFAAVIGAINSLLFAVAVTVGAFVYNVSADLVGGVEVTLSERD